MVILFLGGGHPSKLCIALVTFTYNIELDDCHLLLIDCLSNRLEMKCPVCKKMGRECPSFVLDTIVRMLGCTRNVGATQRMR